MRFVLNDRSPATPPSSAASAEASASKTHWSTNIAKIVLLNSVEGGIRLKMGFNYKICMHARLINFDCGDLRLSIIICWAMYI